MERFSEGRTHTASLADPPAVTPSRMSAEDEKLAARIERHVRRKTNDKVRELRVEISRDGVVLRGRCGTYYCKQLAQHAAMSLLEDAVLLNQIEVW